MEKEAAKNYKTLSIGVQQMYSKELIELADIKSGQAILDIGCGCGNIAAVLSGLVGEKGRVIAIDPDENRIKEAKLSFGDRSNIKFINCRSTEFPCDVNNVYDLALCNMVLHWIPTEEKAKTFKRVFNSLKQGGKFLGNITLKTPKDMQILFSMLSFEEQNDLKSMYHRETYDKLLKLLKEAGFSIDIYKDRRHEANLGKMDVFLKWANALYHGRFDFIEAYKTSLVTEESFERYENGDIKHVSEGCTFVVSKQ